MSAYFHPEQTTKISVDKSPVGLGAILAQVNPTTKVRRIIAYASRSLTTTEQRQCQTEREALAVVWRVSTFTSTFTANQSTSTPITTPFLNHLLASNDGHSDSNRTKQPCITARVKRILRTICLGTLPPAPNPVADRKKSQRNTSIILLTKWSKNECRHVNWPAFEYV